MEPHFSPLPLTAQRQKSHPTPLDRGAVVACLRLRTSKHAGLKHLLRCLVFIEAHFDCHLCPTYISTKENHLADDLSRNNLSSFLFKVPTATPTHPLYPSLYWT